MPPGWNGRWPSSNRTPSPGDLAGAIIQRIEEAGFKIRAMRRVHLSEAEAEGFYAVHRERPFFGSLTAFMSSGPAIVLVLEAPDAIKKWRTLMGATDPAKADAGTLRKEFAESIERNATHGSDAPETAAYRDRILFRGDRAGLNVRLALQPRQPRNEHTKNLFRRGASGDVGKRWSLIGLGIAGARAADDARRAVRPPAGRLRRPARQLQLLFPVGDVDHPEYPSHASLWPSSVADR